MYSEQAWDGYLVWQSGGIENARVRESASLESCPWMNEILARKKMVRLVDSKPRERVDRDGRSWLPEIQQLSITPADQMNMRFEDAQEGRLELLDKGERYYFVVEFW